MSEFHNCQTLITILHESNHTDAYPYVHLVKQLFEILGKQKIMYDTTVIKVKIERERDTLEEEHD